MSHFTHLVPLELLDGVGNIANRESMDPSQFQAEVRRVLRGDPSLILGIVGKTFQIAPGWLYEDPEACFPSWWSFSDVERDELLWSMKLDGLCLEATMTPALVLTSAYLLFALCNPFGPAVSALLLICGSLLFVPLARLKFLMWRRDRLTGRHP